MTGADRPQPADGLRAANLAHDDPVGSQPQRGFDQVRRRHRRFAEPATDRDQPNRILVMKLNFGGVLDQNEPFGRWSFLEQCIEEGRFPGAGPSRDDERLARSHGRGEEFACLAGIEQRRQRGVGRFTSKRRLPNPGKCARSEVIGQSQIGHAVLADRGNDMAARGRRGADLDARTVGQCCREQRMFAVYALIGRRRNLPRQSP